MSSMLLKLTNERHAALSGPMSEAGNGIIPCGVNHILWPQPMRAKQSRAGIYLPNAILVYPVGS